MNPDEAELTGNTVEFYSEDECFDEEFDDEPYICYAMMFGAISFGVDDVGVLATPEKHREGGNGTQNLNDTKRNVEPNFRDGG